MNLNLTLLINTHTHTFTHGIHNIHMGFAEMHGERDNDLKIIILKHECCKYV